MGSSPSATQRCERPLTALSPFKIVIPAVAEFRPDDCVAAGGGNIARRYGPTGAAAELHWLSMTIGEMSCNPSMGGPGRGRLVSEPGALDGIMRSHLRLPSPQE